MARSTDHKYLMVNAAPHPNPKNSQKIVKAAACGTEGLFCCGEVLGLLMVVAVIVDGVLVVVVVRREMVDG